MIMAVVAVIVAGKSSQLILMILKGHAHRQCEFKILKLMIQKALI